MTSSKNAKTYPTYDVTHKKTQSQNFPIFFVQTRKLTRSFEDMNSSLALSPGIFLELLRLVRYRQIIPLKGKTNLTLKVLIVCEYLSPMLPHPLTVLVDVNLVLCHDLYC